MAPEQCVAICWRQMRRRRVLVAASSKTANDRSRDRRFVPFPPPPDRKLLYKRERQRPSSGCYTVLYNTTCRLLLLLLFYEWSNSHMHDYESWCQQVQYRSGFIHNNYSVRITIGQYYDSRRLAVATRIISGVMPWHAYPSFGCAYVLQWFNYLCGHVRRSSSVPIGVQFTLDSDAFVLGHYYL